MVSAGAALLVEGITSLMDLPAPGRRIRLSSERLVTPAGSLTSKSMFRRLLSSSTSSPVAGTPSGNQLAAVVQLLSPASPSHFHCPLAVHDASRQVIAQIIRFIFPIHPEAIYDHEEGAPMLKHRFFIVFFSASCNLAENMLV